MIMGRRAFSEGPNLRNRASFASPKRAMSVTVSAPARTARRHSSSTSGRGYITFAPAHSSLQRHRQPVLRAPFPQPHQHLAALDEAAHDQRLQAGEVGQPVGVGGRGEVQPEPVRLPGDLGIRCARPRHQPGADHVADQRLHCLSGVGVVADEIARAVAEPGERRGDLGVGAGARRRSIPRSGGPAGHPRRRGQGRRSSAAGGRAAAPRPAPPRRSPGRTSSSGSPLAEGGEAAARLGRPAAAAISASTVRMRASRSAAEPYSMVLPS